MRTRTEERHEVKVEVETEEVTYAECHNCGQWYEELVEVRVGPEGAEVERPMCPGCCEAMLGFDADEGELTRALRFERRRMKERLAEEWTPLRVISACISVAMTLGVAGFAMHGFGYALTAMSEVSEGMAAGTAEMETVPPIIELLPVFAGLLMLMWFITLVTRSGSL